MTHNVLTSFNEKYYIDIAKNNIQLLDKHWPKDCSISLYHQLPKVEAPLSVRVNWLDLYEVCPDLLVFKNQWKDEPKANGTFTGKIERAFRYNAIKFAHKTFAIWHAAKKQKSGWLLWLDCDTVVMKSISASFLKNICPDNYAISYMGRPGKYSECGFIGFNLDKNETREFLSEWENLYTSGEFIHLDETHDSWTFDWLRLKKNPSLFFNVNSLATTNKNPFAQSLLGDHIAHAKGQSKEKTTKKIMKKIR